MNLYITPFKINNNFAVTIPKKIVKFCYKKKNPYSFNRKLRTRTNHPHFFFFFFFFSFNRKSRAPLTAHWKTALASALSITNKKRAQKARPPWTDGN